MIGKSLWKMYIWAEYVLYTHNNSGDVHSWMKVINCHFISDMNVLILKYSTVYIHYCIKHTSTICIDLVLKYHLWHVIIQQCLVNSVIVFVLLYCCTDSQVCIHGIIMIKVKRHKQNLMTNDVNKVWPNGILPYQIDDEIGKNNWIFGKAWILLQFSNLSVLWYQSHPNCLWHDVDVDVYKEE